MYTNASSPFYCKGLWSAAASNEGGLGGRGIAKRRGRREKGPEVLCPSSCGGIGDSLREGGRKGAQMAYGGEEGLSGKEQERLWWRAGGEGLDRNEEGGGEKVGKGIEKKAFCG